MVNAVVVAQADGDRPEIDCPTCLRGEACAENERIVNAKLQARIAELERAIEEWKAGASARLETMSLQAARIADLEAELEAENAALKADAKQCYCRCAK